MILFVISDGFEKGIPGDRVMRQNQRTDLRYGEEAWLFIQNSIF